jgi:UDP-N-acetylglucosamine 4,6-dehydratase
MRVMDLAEAIAPGLPIQMTGIRPGEKLHEVLLTTDESRHAVELEDMFVILPEHPWWTEHSPWAEAKPVKSGFAYASENNDHWLGVDELRALLA